MGKPYTNKHSKKSNFHEIINFSFDILKQRTFILQGSSSYYVLAL